MNLQRLAYDDADNARTMHEDCSAAARQIRSVPSAPSIRYEDFPRDVAKPEIEVSEAAARLAASFQLD